MKGTSPPYPPPQSRDAFGHHDWEVFRGCFPAPILAARAGSGPIARQEQELPRRRPMPGASLSPPARKPEDSVRPTALPPRPRPATARVPTDRPGGKDWLGPVAQTERARLRQWTSEYRRCQRGRAQPVKRRGQRLAGVDPIAQPRLLAWPEAHAKEPP